MRDHLNICMRMKQSLVGSSILSTENNSLKFASTKKRKRSLDEGRRGMLFMRNFHGCVTMVNLIWALMAIIGICYAIINGRMEEVNEAIFESANEAVTLTISFISILVFWL